MAIKRSLLAFLIGFCGLALSACGSTATNTSSAGNSQGYIAGWNFIAPDNTVKSGMFAGYTEVGALGFDQNCTDMYSDTKADLNQMADSNWNQNEWVQGCNDALDALNSERANGNSGATISTR